MRIFFILFNESIFYKESILSIIFTKFFDFFVFFYRLYFMLQNNLKKYI